MMPKRRKKIIGAATAAVVVLGVAGLFARNAFAYTYYGGVTATAEGTGAMTGNDPSLINAQESYDLKANGTQLWEINLYPVNTTADITTNKGYLFVSQSQLPANLTDGQHTSFSGGWGNPGFVEHVLMNSSQHEWELQQSNGSDFPATNFDYYAMSDITDMNGMKDTTNFNVKVNGVTQAFYEPQTSLTISNVALPHITTPLLYTAPSGGSQVSSIATGNTYYLNPNMFTAYGSNGGGMYSQNYFAAYWVPIVNGQPDTSAATYAFTENDNGLKTVYDWPGVGTIIKNGGLDSASTNAYGSGFMNDFELVPNSSAPSTGQLEVFLPGSFPSGTSSVDLVAYYSDGVQRYDAQIANFTLKSTAPVQTTCPNVSLSTSGSGQTGTLTISDPSNAALTLSASNGATLSKASVSSSTTVSIDMPSGTPGQAETTTITAKDSSAADSSCPPATISYSYTPPALNGLTLSANPTSQTVGKGSTLTADYTGSTSIGSNSIVIHDLGGRYTLNNGGTTTYTGNSGATTATTTALANSAYTESYDATVKLSNGQTVTSDTVNITWSVAAPPSGTGPAATTSLTLAANPTQLQVGGTTKLTVTVPPDPSTGLVASGEYVQVYDQTTGQNVSTGYYTGSTNMTTAYTSGGETESFSVTDTSSTAGSQNFVAELWNPGVTPWNNPSNLTSNTKTVTWSKPSIMLTASIMNPPSAQVSQLSYTTTDWQPGDHVDVSSIGGADGWHISNDTNSSDSYAEGEVPKNGQSVSDTTTAKLYNSSGVLLSTSTITVTWLAPSGVITAKPLTAVVGQPVLLITTVQNLASFDYIQVIDESTGRVIATGQPGQTQVEVTVTKYQATYDTFNFVVRD